jgi:hypothetical protein
MENMPVPQTTWVSKKLFRILLVLTKWSQLKDNTNTDNRQNDSGLASASFGFYSLDMQLSEVYWMGLSQHPFVVSESLLQR